MNGANFRALRALLAQGDEDYLATLAALLHQGGFATAEARDVTAALAALRHGEADLALLDVSLAGTDLAAVLKEAVALRRPVPVLLLPADQGAYEKARLLRAVLDRMAAAVLVADRDEGLLYCNAAAERLLGIKNGCLTSDDCLRQQELYRDDTSPPLPPGARPLARALRGEVVDAADVFVRQNGSGVGLWLCASARPLRDELGHPLGAVVVYQDITDHKLNARSLKEAEERVRALLEAVDEGLCLVQDGEVHYANVACARLFGHTKAAELIDRPLEELAAADDQAALVARVEAWLAGAETCVAFAWQPPRRDGGPTWLEATARPIDWHERPGVLLTVRDVSGQRQLENRYLQGQGLEALGRLARGLAHDFNNLLTVVNGYGEMLQQKLRADFEGQSMLAEIVGAGARAAALTSQLLALSREPTRGRGDADLNRQVQDLSAMLARLVGPNVRLTMDLEPGLGAVRADAGQLDQLVLNLAVNARDAMPHGGELTVRTAAADLDAAFLAGERAAKPGRYAVLAVADTGGGADEAGRRRLLEPFLSGREAPLGPTLGLAAVLCIVKQAEGVVRVDSDPGGGTTFRVYLHLSAAAFRT
jgi:PAS domain S-box-containing protein